MNEVAKLSRLERDSERLLEQTNRVVESPPAGLPDGLTEQFVALSKALSEMLESARSRVKIGLVGEYSAGKSLLLGGIIGYADLLPVSESATTGNVTVLTFVQSDDDGAAAVQEIEVEYLDQDRVATCLAFMLMEAKGRAISAQLPPQASERLGEILGPGLEGLRIDQLDAVDAQVLRRLTEPAQLAAVQQWCKEAWDKENPGLRFLVREIVAFVRAYNQCGNGLCQGPKTYTFKGEDAVRRVSRGLQLTEPPLNLQAMKFADLPSPPRAINYPPEPLTAEDLGATFHLIRRVRVKVRVPRRVWDFASDAVDDEPADGSRKSDRRDLGDLDTGPPEEGEPDLRPVSRFELLDFPGLGAESSGVRDLYLCLRELGEVQTILIVLNGYKPGGDVGLKLYDFMQRYRPDRPIRDNVLAAIGRFDQLPLKNEGKIEALERLATVPALPTASTTAPSKKKGPVVTDDEDEAQATAPTATPPTPTRLTEAQVFEAIPILKTAMSNAEALVSNQDKHRIVLVSPLLYLKGLAEDNPTIPVGSPGFLGGLDRAAADGIMVKKLWKAVADRLESASPGLRMRAGLTRCLDDFAADGGVSRLRHVLTSHVQEYGMHQLLETVVEKRRKVQKIQQVLKAKVAPKPGTAVDRRTWEDRLARGRKQLNRLAEYYQDLAIRIKDKRELPLRRDGVAVPLNEILLEEVADEVANWPQWKALLESSSNGMVKEERDGGPVVRDEDDEPGGTTNSNFPQNSEHFLKDFERSLGTLAASVRKLLAKVVAGLIEEVAEAVAAEREELGGPLSVKDLPARVRALDLGDNGQGLVRLLRMCVNPEGMLPYLLPNLATTPAPTTPVDGEEPSWIQKLTRDAEARAEQFELPALPTATRLFPLPQTRRDGSGRAAESTARTFAWAKTVNEKPEAHRPEPHHAHQSMVYRIRTDITTTLGQELAQLLGAGMERLVEDTLKLLDDINKRLPFAMSEERVLDEMYRPDAPAEAGPPAADDPLAKVRHLATFEWLN